MSSETRLRLFPCQILSQLIQEGKCVEVVTRLNPVDEMKTLSENAHMNEVSWRPLPTPKLVKVVERNRWG